MLQFSAALLSRAFGPLIALFSSPCGRHSTFGRRRRSTRVRRYAPAPPQPPAPAPAPRLDPPSEAFAGDPIALVRPYYAAHERVRASLVPAPRTPQTESDEVQRAFARVQERAAALLQQWQDDPSGVLFGEPAPRFGVVRLAESVAPVQAWSEQRQGVPA